MVLDDSSGELMLVASDAGNMHAVCEKTCHSLCADISGDHEAPPPTGRPLQNGSAAQTTMRSQAEGGSGQQQETGNTRPRRNAKRAAAADANNCVQGNDFFMPTTKKKRKV